MKRLIASSLCVLLASCGTPRHTASPSTEPLTRLVLIIRELPDGSVTHAWQSADDFNLSEHVARSVSVDASGRIALGPACKRDCDEELHECMQECMSRPLARGFGHITSRGGKGGKEEYCNRKCMQPYQDCMNLQDLRPQEFVAMDPAVDWLKSNRKTLLVGSIIVIAGVAFVAVSAGVGLLVLAPVVLVSAVGTPAESPLAVVAP